MQDLRDHCLADVANMVRSQLRADSPELATVSIALGILEANLCHKNPEQQGWPTSFQASTQAAADSCLFYRTVALRQAYMQQQTLVCFVTHPSELALMQAQLGANTAVYHAFVQDQVTAGLAKQPGSSTRVRLRSTAVAHVCSS